MQGKQRNVMSQIQELLCFRAIVVSSDPRSEPETAKKNIFLEESLEKVTFITKNSHIENLGMTKASG